MKHTNKDLIVVLFVFFVWLVNGFVAVVIGSQIILTVEIKAKR